MRVIRSSVDSWWRQIVYASGNLGKSVVWTTSETFLLVHLVTLVDLSPAAAGALMAVVLAVEGLADIVIGSAARRLPPRSPSQSVLMAAPVCGISFWIVFADLDLPGAARPVQVIGALLLCRFCYTLCDLTHNALVIRLARDPGTATTVAGMRLMFSSLGAALVGGAAAMLVQDGWGASPEMLSLLAGAGGLLYALLVPAAVRVVRDPSMRSDCPAGSRLSLVACLRSRAVRTLLYLVFLQACAAPLLLKMLPFVSHTRLGAAAFSGKAVVIVAVVQGAALPCWTMIGRRMPVGKLLAVGHGLLALSALALGVGLSAGSSVASGTAIAMFGAAQAAMSVAIWAYLPLTAKMLHTDDKAVERLLTGIFLAALKWGSGMGTGILGLLVAASERAALPVDDVLGPATMIAIAGSTVCLGILFAVTPRSSNLAVL